MAVGAAIAVGLVVALAAIWFFVTPVRWASMWLWCGGKDPVLAYDADFGIPYYLYVAPRQPGYTKAPPLVEGPSHYFCSIAQAQAQGYRQADPNEYPVKSLRQLLTR